MKKFMNFSLSLVVVLTLVALLSGPAVIQGSGNEDAQQAEAEMKSALGTVPLMMKVYPERMRAGAWKWFQATQSPGGAVPAKYVQLIALGVAAQIPCEYCVYAHTSMARMLGATEEEIQEAIATAAETRHWSTVLNGNSVSFEEFKTDWDGVLEHLQSQQTSEEMSKK